MPQDWFTLDKFDKGSKEPKRETLTQLVYAWSTSLLNNELLNRARSNYNKNK